MKKKITFHNMDHSAPLEAHAHQKLDKILDMLKGEGAQEPHMLELWLKAHKQHPHHGAELHLKTPDLDLHAHDEGTDMYVVLDSAIDKIVKLLKKEREKKTDKVQKQTNEKRKFAEEDDKYTLGD